MHHRLSIGSPDGGVGSRKYDIREWPWLLTHKNGPDVGITESWGT